MNVHATGWSGEGDFTKRLIQEMEGMPGIASLKVEDAPASRADSGFSFISNEVYIVFATRHRTIRARRFGFIPVSRVVNDTLLSIPTLETALAAVPEIGLPDYSDGGMLQYLRTERILQRFQTRGFKLIELVRIYEAGTAPRRDA